MISAARYKRVKMLLLGIINIAKYGASSHVFRLLKSLYGRDQMSLTFVLITRNNVSVASYK